MSKDNQADDSTATRSGLLWEVERLLKELCDTHSPMPDVLVMENVTQVHGKKNIDDFNSWISSLESMGYRTNVWCDMNSRDFGVAQNRDRTFMVSIYDPYEEYSFEFPKPIELEKIMDEYLELEVDDKYFLESERKDKLIENLIIDGTLPNPETATLDDIQKCFSIPPEVLSKILHELEMQNNCDIASAE